MTAGATIKKRQGNVISGHAITMMRNSEIRNYGVISQTTISLQSTGCDITAGKH